MCDQIKNYGIEEVTKKITLALSKCVEGLGIQMTPDALQLLSSDIIDVYSFDSIEDVIEALKAGRQGKYGTTYNKLNMVVINEWMSKQLEHKAILREKEHDKLKQLNILGAKEVPNVDYDAFRKRKEEERHEEEEISDKEKAYREFKFKHQNPKPKKK